MVLRIEPKRDRCKTSVSALCWLSGPQWGILASSMERATQADAAGFRAESQGVREALAYAIQTIQRESKTTHFTDQTAVAERGIESLALGSTQV